MEHKRVLMDFGAEKKGGFGGGVYKSRSREFFDFHREYLLPLKREWFLNRPGTDVLRVDTMDRETMGKAVLKWVDTVANNH